MQEVENVVNALKEGKKFNNVIISCYLQMSHLLQEEKGMERNNNMTVQEFETWLEVKGVPRVPVHQLTYFFEKIRYGNQPLSKGDEEYRR